METESRIGHPKESHTKSLPSNKLKENNSDKTQNTRILYDKIAEIVERSNSLSGSIDGKIAERLVTYTEVSDHIDKFLTKLQDGVKKIQDTRILDAGCGTGINALYMASCGFTIICNDLSPNMLKLSKDLLRQYPNTKYILQDMRRLRIHANSIDGILASYSLIHMPKKDILSTLRLFSNFLKIDGIICIAVQCGKKSWQGYKAHRITREKVFLSVFSEIEIVLQMEEAGFSIIERYHRPPKEYEWKFTKVVLIAKKNRRYDDPKSNYNKQDRILLF